MSKKNRFPHFLYDFRSGIVIFPSMLLYVGILPILKFFGAISWSWIWVLAPIWFPFIAFWIATGFISFIALVAEIGFLILPDENFLDGKKKDEL